MSKKPLHLISDIELKKALKRAKALTIVQGILVLFMLIIGIVNTIYGGVSVFTFLPLFFLPMVFIGLYQMNQFKGEINRRKEV